MNDATRSTPAPAVDRDVLNLSTTGLVLFDLLEGYRPNVEEAGALPALVRLAEACRDRGVPIFHAIADHHPAGIDYGRTLTDTKPDGTPYGRHEPPRDRYQHEGPARRILVELGPDDRDEVVRKHRWNAFFQTHLELALRMRRIDTIVLVGGSAHVGVAATAFGARDRDFHVVIVSDGCTGRQPQRDQMVEHVFPGMARVRTTEEVIEMLGPGAR